MKRILIAIAALAISLNLAAQTERTKLLSNEEFFEKADFIIEGISANKNAYAYDINDNYDPNDIYTSSLFVVTYVYKNNSNEKVSIGDTLNLIIKGGTIYKKVEDQWGYYVEEIIANIERPILDVVKEEPSICFFTKSALPEDINANKNDKFLKVNLLQNKKGAAIKFWGGIKGLNALSFKDRYELYEYMKQYKDITIPENILNNKNEQNMNNNPEQQENKWDNKLLEQKREVAEKNKKKGLNDAKAASDIDLTVEITNQQVNFTGGKYYFEFDVNVSSTSTSKYFDEMQMNLLYNTVAFGESISANNKVVTTLDNLNFPSTNGYSTEKMDISSSCIAFRGGVGYTNINRVQLSPTPKRLMHITIELNNNSNGMYANLEFTNTAYTRGGCFFTNYSNSEWYEVLTYDNTYYINPDPFTISTETSITSFSPATIHAGTDDILTITGTNFGSVKGQVLFTSAERGGLDSLGNIDFLKGLDGQYVSASEWTNTQIKVKVPSFVKKGYVGIDEISTLPGYGSSAGTGPIKIITANNDTVVSDDILTIDYSITNCSQSTSDTIPIERVYLARLNCDYDIEFYLHNNMQSNLSAIAAIEAAISKWNEVTGLSLRLVKDASNNYEYKNSFPDYSSNVIGFDSTLDSVLMATRGMFQKDVVSNKFYRRNGSHIRIRPTPATGFTWNYSTTNSAGTTEASFYNFMLHELGHISLLSHVNSYGELMYHGDSIQKVNPIINLLNETNALAGVNDTKTESQSITWSPILSTLGYSLPSPMPTPVITSNTGSFVVCNGGTLTLSVQSIPGATHYSWPGGYTGQTCTVYDYEAGEYTVTVYFGACSTVSAPVMVTVDSLATPTITSSTGGFIVCNSNPITLSTPSISGGSYLWSNGTTTETITVSSDGTYSVTVINAGGCTIASAPYTVGSSTLYATFDVTIPTVTPVPCTSGTVNSDGSITTTIIDSHPPQTILWSHGSNQKDIYDLGSGSYFVTITNSKGCSANYGAFLLIPLKQPIEIGRIPIVTDSNCKATANVAGGTSPYTYEWKKTYTENGNTQTIIISTADTASVPCNSSYTFLQYTFTVTDSCGSQRSITVPCCESSKSVKFDNSEDGYTQQSEIIIYPNPTNNTFKIFGIENAIIEISDLSGKIIKSQNDITENSEISVANLPNGIYFVKIFENNNIIYKKLVKV